MLAFATRWQARCVPMVARRTAVTVSCSSIRRALYGSCSSPSSDHETRRVKDVRLARLLWPAGPDGAAIPPQGLFGAAPTAFAPYAPFGTLPGPWGPPTGPSIGGWPGSICMARSRRKACSALCPGHTRSAVRGLRDCPRQSPVHRPWAPERPVRHPPGQQAQQMSPYPQLGQPPIGYPFGGWPGQMQLACITPQGLIAILPGQFAQPIGLGQPMGPIGAWPAQQQLWQPFRRRRGAQLPALPGAVPDGLRLSG